ncbi:hypothetical protein [Elizabethkingia phage TCUEAP1]|nr:hypothetical protein [Elizabethkingia phage TCUEAP1]
MKIGDKVLIDQKYFLNLKKHMSYVDSLEEVAEFMTDMVGYIYYISDSDPDEDDPETKRSHGIILNDPKENGPRGTAIYVDPKFLKLIK